MQSTRSMVYQNANVMTLKDKKSRAHKLTMTCVLGKEQQSGRPAGLQWVERYTTS